MKTVYGVLEIIGPSVNNQPNLPNWENRKTSFKNIQRASKFKKIFGFSTMWNRPRFWTGDGGVALKLWSGRDIYNPRMYLPE